MAEYTLWGIRGSSGLGQAKLNSSLGVHQVIHGRYRVLAELAAGGMGITYRAWDSCFGVPVVIKMPRPGGSGREGERLRLIRRFANEIDVMRGLPHAHIVPITASGEHDGLPFAVMRFLPGGSLNDRRPKGNSPKKRRMAPATLWRWLPDVADALDFIHGRGVVHRDVKPSNIFFDGLWNAFLGDFGIAKILSESLVLKSGDALTTMGSGIGTLEYMAPELLRRNLHPTGRSDQYSLGIVIYEILSGGRPFTGGVYDIRLEHATLRPPSLADLRLPSTLTEAIERALEKNPEQRFATCTSFVEQALRDIQPPAREEGVVRLLCPGCKSVLRLSPTTGGKRGKCPECAAPVETAEGCVALWLQAEASSLGKAETSVGFPQEGGTRDITTTLNPPSSEEIAEGSPADQATPQTLLTFPEHRRRWRVPRKVALPILITLTLGVLSVGVWWLRGGYPKEVPPVPTDGPGGINPPEPKKVVVKPQELVGRTLSTKDGRYEACPDGAFIDRTHDDIPKDALGLHWHRIGEEPEARDSCTYYVVTNQHKPWLIIGLWKDKPPIKFYSDEDGKGVELSEPDAMQ